MHHLVHKSSYKPVLLPATWETSTYYIYIHIENHFSYLSEFFV